MKKNKDKTLSIQVSLNGLSFCIHHNQKINKLYSVEFKSKLTPFDTQNKLKTELENHLEFVDVFKRVNVIHHNAYVTVVPNLIFDETLKPDYLKFNTKILKTDFIDADICSAINARVVYIPYTNINNYLIDNFNSINYYHTATYFINCAMRLKTRPNEVFINIESKEFQLLIIKDNQFALYLIFEYDTQEDLLYYLLFSLEQLKMNNENLNINISGIIQKNSELYQLIYTYVQYVNFIDVPKNTKFDSKIDENEISKHNILLHNL